MIIVYSKNNDLLGERETYDDFLLHPEEYYHLYYQYYRSKFVSPNIDMRLVVLVLASGILYAFILVKKYFFQRFHQSSGSAGSRITGTRLTTWLLSINTGLVSINLSYFCCRKYYASTYSKVAFYRSWTTNC